MSVNFLQVKVSLPHLAKMFSMIIGWGISMRLMRKNYVGQFLLTRILKLIDSIL